MKAMKRRAFFGIITGMLAAAGLKLEALRIKAPVRPLRIPDLEAHGVPTARLELLAEDGVFCDEAISRWEEWMAREALLNGGSIP